MTPPPRHARLTAARALVADNPLLVVIAGIGFAVSFQTIARLATAEHMPGYPVLYPVLIDVGFLAAVIEERHAIRAGRSDIAPRILAWALGALTVYVNAHGSPAGDWLGLTLHVSAPALWIAFLELTRWRKIRKACTPTEEEARLARALADARRYAIDLARSLRGPLWRWRVPSLLRRQVLTGRFPDEVRDEVERCVRLGKTTGWQASVREWVTGKDGLNLNAQAQADARKAASAIASETPPGTPAATPSPRQNARQNATPDRAKARAKAKRLLAANPGIPLADVSAKTGLSERTVSRIKGELPTPLRVAR